MQSFGLGKDTQVAITHNLFGDNAVQTINHPTKSHETPKIIIETDEDESDEDESDEESDNDNGLETLKKYYQSLGDDQVDFEIEIMKVSNNLELYRLIANDCKLYISIIENYKKENLQNLFNINIKWVEGHLLIKYKLDPLGKTTEVGFFDNNNTLSETLNELKKSIELSIKLYDSEAQNRRAHIAGHFEKEDDKPITTDKPKPKAIPDDYFKSNGNENLQPTQKQLEAAGYKSVPSSLKSIEKELKNGEFDIDPNNLNEQHLINNSEVKQPAKNTSPKKIRHDSPKKSELNSPKKSRCCSPKKEINIKPTIRKQLPGVDNLLQMLDTLQILDSERDEDEVIAGHGCYDRFGSYNKHLNVYDQYHRGHYDNEDYIDTEAELEEEYHRMVVGLTQTDKKKKMLAAVLDNLPNIPLEQCPYVYSFLDKLLNSTNNNDILSYCIAKNKK